MVGQGSVNHNSRKFHAKNTDPERSHLNITYCQENIKAVYHELFDEALERYNAKQTRADRRIEDYYEKIRSGKQEKPFHEIILQVGNRDDMSADSEEGQLAAAVLDEYMKGFQERNPQLRVFSAHLHMDEATPHLHIDFVPFTTGSKRGLDTRVSLKQALAAQGFQGGTRGDTEWSQWVRSEKEQLSLVMERHGIEWEDKGTHDKHLSVLDYKKEQRAKEIAVLETVKAEKENQVESQERRLKELAPAVKNMERLGVRTESWTVKRSGLEVRMYSREKVELFLLATEDGMGPTAAAKFAGVTVGAAKKWATGHLPHSYTGARCRIGARKPRRKEASLGPDKSIYAPPATGPLAGLNEDQIENLLLRAVLADLKAEGWDPASISNRSKCELGERLRRATALPLRSITGFLRISKSSYEYWRPRVAAPRDRDADIRDRVVRIFREGSGCWGYRTVWARLRREGVRASEKRVARVMREAGLEVVYNKRRARGYSSYAGEVSKAPENLVNRNFHADEPNRLWLTDITEFRLPGGEKVYLSPVIDCFDGMPVAWSIGLHPDKRLANSSLLKACAARPAGARTTIHSDRGGHYRWPEWIGICEENGLVRSMSAKGCSPDNSACEGFFGRLKNEFFRYRDWEGVTAEEFMGRLEAYLVYYRDGRIKKSLEWLSPMEYRRKLGYA